MNGAEAVAGSLSVTMESDTLYPVLGLAESRTVYDKSPGMDFYTHHNSEGGGTGRPAWRALEFKTQQNIELNYQLTVQISQPQNAHCISWVVWGPFSKPP